MVEPHTKIKKFPSSGYIQCLTRTAQTQNLRNVLKLIKKISLKYHMIISIQILCMKWNQMNWTDLSKQGEHIRAKSGTHEVKSTPWRPQRMSRSRTQIWTMLWDISAFLFLMHFHIFFQFCPRRTECRLLRGKPGAFEEASPYEKVLCIQYFPYPSYARLTSAARVNVVSGISFPSASEKQLRQSFSAILEMCS